MMTTGASNPSAQTAKTVASHAEPYILLKLSLDITSRQVVIMDTIAMAPKSISTRQIYAAVTPYVLFGLLMLAAVMAVPALATWLPRVLLGK